MISAIDSNSNLDLTYGDQGGGVPPSSGGVDVNDTVIGAPDLTTQAGIQQWAAGYTLSALYPGASYVGTILQNGFDVTNANNGAQAGTALGGGVGLAAGGFVGGVPGALAGGALGGIGGGFFGYLGGGAIGPSRPSNGIGVGISVKI